MRLTRIQRNSRRKAKDIEKVIKLIAYPPVAVGMLFVKSTNKKKRGKKKW